MWMFCSAAGVQIAEIMALFCQLHWLLHDFLIFTDLFLRDHSLFYLNWEGDKSQIKLTRSSGALRPCVPKPATFLPACDQFITLPEGKHIVAQVENHRSPLCWVRKPCAFQNFPLTSIFCFYLPASLWSSTRYVSVCQRDQNTLQDFFQKRAVRGRWLILPDFHPAIWSWKPFPSLKSLSSSFTHSLDHLLVWIIYCMVPRILSTKLPCLSAADVFSQPLNFKK